MGLRCLELRLMAGFRPAAPDFERFLALLSSFLLASALAEPLLRVEPMGAGKAPVVRCDGIFPDELAEVACDSLCQAPRVDEDQSRSVCFDERCQLLVDFFPHLERHHRFER